MKLQSWNFNAGIWVFYGKSKKQAIKDAIYYLKFLVEDAEEKNFSNDIELLDNFSKIEKSVKVDFGRHTRPAKQNGRNVSHGN